MKRITLLLVAAVILAGIVALTVPAALRADDSGAPIFVTKIPSGYREWRLISVAHEEGNLNSIGAVLGNDVAIKAYRECTTATSRRRKTTKSLAKPNLSSLVPPRTFSLW
jgi:hypothetical protein